MNLLIKRYQTGQQLIGVLKYQFSILDIEKKICVIHSQVNDIHFNLATEEYLYEHHNLKYPTLFLWRNDKTIVIGRHQNPWKECFIQNMERDGIKLARRRTGGSAVYQDLGNSCFSFITPVYDNSNPLDSKNKNNIIIVNSLKNLGVDAQFTGRNDIVCQGRKISGSAYQVNLGKKDGSDRKALHHGTMLFNVNTESVKNYLNPNKEKLKSKGVDSVISRILNLNEIKPDLNHDFFVQQLEIEFAKFYSSHQVISEKLDYESLKQNQNINQIFNEISSWDWLYGQTPKFTNNIETRFDWGIIDFYFQVENNIIKECKVYSDCLYADFISKMNRIFK
ncbi:lipoate-protein ligase a, putative, partial [Ichthyophthirius multifiliis]